ncbi:MAG: DUF2235 domain-containing protein [Verrucomicrobia bacterium]|nr:DUF2235 domain-containing protein [Verrucomicrobiota bacterium]MDA1069527.1 DUF2235 domain-containing protein [Verrucomicrobiota bacterium]
MRRLIVCCDGSWRKLGSKYPSNVIKLAQAVKRRDGQKVAQVVYYREGVGANNKSRLGGMLGLGLDEDIMSAYTFLALNYEPGDEVFLFGFSRGAYTARSLAGLIHCSGLVSRSRMRKIPEAFELYRDRSVRPGSDKAIRFRAIHGERIPIQVLGCWDTVGALGIPFNIPGTDWGERYNNRFAFHDTCINRSVKFAFHAKAIDELRAVFEVTPMNPGARTGQVIEEAWFPGDHSCVGGGTEAKAPLANRCLFWMLERMRAHGIQLATDHSRVETGVEIDHTAPFDNTIRGFYRLTGSKPRAITGSFDQIDISTRFRWRDCPDYRPKNLSRRFRSKLDKGVGEERGGL